MKSVLRHPGGKFYMLEDIMSVFRRSRMRVFIDVFGDRARCY